MITGLKDNEAVIFGDLVQVKLPYGSYEVDGVGLSGGNVVTVSKDSVINKVKMLGMETTHYYSTKENCQDCISIEEYQSLKESSYGEWDDDLEQYVYESLEQEFECRKEQEELQFWKPSQVDRGYELECFEYVVVGVLEDTRSPFIESPIIYGKVSWNGGRSFYKCNLSGAAFKRYSEYESKYKKSVRFDNDSYQYLRFAKVNGNYVFADKSPFQDKSILYTDTLEKAKELISGAIKEVDRVLGPIVNPIELGIQDAGKLLAAVGRVIDTTRGLDVKQKSSSSKVAILRKLQEIENDLKSVVDKGLEENSDD